MYFAHHQGDHIRMAYSDNPAGPWKVYEPGALHLSDSFFVGHIASPDVHAVDGEGLIRMYFHGCVPDSEQQYTRVALSGDGLHFTAEKEILGHSYFRVFRHGAYFYALEMPGVFRRSRDGLHDFELGPALFDSRMRHSALAAVEPYLHVFFTNAGDCPERILRTTIDISSDWQDWRTSPTVDVLAPEKDYEGSGYPLEASVRGSIHRPVRQLRDPYLFFDRGKTFLYYSIAGENGIGAAQVIGFPYNKTN